jgi:N6-L-threonylcarbamoyladenine synthase
MTLRHAQDLVILAIETSLDDTSAAIVDGVRILSNVVASQVKFHEEWGGTVPDIARRKHQEWIEPVIEKAIRRAGISNEDIDAVAVTYGPGLAPSLEVGIDHARAWATKLHVPLIPVNHLEGHLLSSFACNRKGNDGAIPEAAMFPAIGFLISGGHTELVLMEAVGKYFLLGETLDDAAGEAYDKVARMLQLGYPGGPILAEMAKLGTPRYTLPVPMIGRKDFDFSFSGLKTAALNALRKLEDVPHDKQFLADFSASFQHAALTHLMKKLDMAMVAYQPLSVFLGGGVVSNVTLREAARAVAKKHDARVYIPQNKVLFTDNAGMIGVAAHFIAQQGRILPDAMTIDRQPNLNFPRLSLE